MTQDISNTVVETKVRHLKQKDISASVFPDIFFPQVTSTKTCYNIYVWPTQTNKQKEDIFQGNPSRKNLKKKCCLLSSLKVQSCVPKHKMLFLKKKRKILVQPNTKQESNKNHRLMKRKTKELKTNQGWN